VALAALTARSAIADTGCVWSRVQRGGSGAVQSFVRKLATGERRAKLWLVTGAWRPGRVEDSPSDDGDQNDNCDIQPNLSVEPLTWHLWETPISCQMSRRRQGRVKCQAAV
jgi:hypothetical protein